MDKIRHFNKINRKIVDDVNETLFIKSIFHLSYSNEVKNTTKNGQRVYFREILLKVKDRFNRDMFILNLENDFDKFSLKLLASKIDNIKSLHNLKNILENY